MGSATILSKAVRCLNVQQCDEKHSRAFPCTHELHPLLELQIYRVTLTVKADTMSDLPTLANQSEGPQLFTCPICLEECPRQEIFVPSGCSHEFCRECARGVVLSAVRWVYHLPSNAGRLSCAALRRSGSASCCRAIQHGPDMCSLFDAAPQTCLACFSLFPHTHVH